MEGVQPNVVHDHTFLFRTLPTLDHNTRTYTFSAGYFALVNLTTFLYHLYSREMTSTLPPLVQAFSGAIGSATANALVYPLDLVATRLQTTSSKRLRGECQPTQAVKQINIFCLGFNGILLALQHVLSAEGWSGLYDGLSTDTAATIVSK